MYELLNLHALSYIYIYILWQGVGVPYFYLSHGIESHKNSPHLQLKILSIQNLWHDAATGVLWQRIGSMSCLNSMFRCVGLRIVIQSPSYMLESDPLSCSAAPCSTTRGPFDHFEIRANSNLKVLTRISK
jgi:hypothetical protein